MDFQLRRDAAETAGRLRDWFGEVRGLADVGIDNLSIPSSTGASNETILFDATWTGPSGTEQHQLVARIAPTSYVVFPEDTFERQFHVMGALAERSNVPMAAVHWFEPEKSWFGAPFWIMERVRGQIPGDAQPYALSGWLAEATPRLQRRAWISGTRAIAAVHTTSLGGLALDPTLIPTPRDPLDAELERYERFLAWAEDGDPYPLAREALAWLRQNQPAPPAEGPTLVWGDSRLSNLIFEDFEVAAVLDWEMATIGDPLLDLGWWLFTDETLTRGVGAQRLPGFLSREETAALWRETTGRSTDALPYFEVFAGLRFTVIMARMGKLLAERGVLPASFAYDNLFGQGLRRAMARA
ncbi:phosphotransferase family protein [Frankia sp. CNm7]|uniref:Phosphotransferase family protein n=1 Tax=Frankia nepalensis TaxID=1836974 RepID=A0A937RLR1_9ACTN|nr:phosphotransferase family protein [Frankia nepalensis]MBL7501172.1 phosphotransferase family protein [Frankia nepalensis]MBL7512626.1 phosphotransferase family protein [Frankia nepalensis]MBL7520891.1 phosphotransferase family protein [Frankia nepalensis]MBL7632682.1 phosphotransferase family protein [Frankia nepalensis]